MRAIRERGGPVARIGALALLALLIVGVVPAFSTAQAGTSPWAGRNVGALVKNPAAYAHAKAVANARYAKWAARHGIATKTPAGPLTSISLSHTGLAASDAPNIAQGGPFTPPDTTGAIGPSNYVEMVNSEIGVWSSSDLSAAPTTLAQNTFFGDSSASTCDGQIQWDQQGQRWIYAGLNCQATAGQENLYVGFSKGTSPLPLDSSNWCQYQIPTLSNLEDYPKLGHDDTQIIIGANEFPDAGGFNGGKIFVLPKPAPGTIGTCPTQTAEVTNSLVTLSVPSAFTPVPVNIADSSATGYVVATDDVSLASSTNLYIYNITSSTTSGSPSPSTIVTVPSYSMPASVPQQGTSNTLDSLDGRLTQAVAVKVNGTGPEEIWTQHTVDGGGPSIVRWYELTPGSLTPAQTGTVKGPGGAFAFMGAISPSTNGSDVALFYNSSSSTTLPDFRVENRHALTAAGEMGDDLQLATSAFAATDFSCSPCRWGDYNGASPDPSNANLVWGTGELTTFAPDGNGTPQWGSQNAAIDVSAAATYNLNVARAGAGSGSVASVDTNISCPSTCSYAYTYGASVQLNATATPGTHSTFAGWSGDCTGTGTCNVTMGNPKSVTATFTVEQDRLTYTLAGNGSGFVTSSPAGITCGSSCFHDFNWNTQVELTATAGTGSTFSGWSGACTVVNGKCDVSMDQARSVTATFTLVPETLTVSKAGAGTGTVSSTVAGISCGTTCSHPWNYGTSVTLTASPGVGSVFTGWSGACTGTGSCTVSLNAAKAVTATFGLIPETLTVTKKGTGSGTVSSTIAGISCGPTCASVFDYGTSVTLTAKPASNATFAGWSGACSGKGNCTVPMTAASSVTATFTKLVCVVPKLKGKTLAAAKRAINAANCTVGKVTKATSRTVKSGKVISQKPAAGKRLAYHARVNLTVSKGKG